ncbi:MAG: SPFH domain-containing protein [Thermoplasmata archaeon]|jgi:membrane protease subunit (stomatin/prohibitin family)
MFKKKDSYSSGNSVIGATTIEWADEYKKENIMWKVPRNIRLNDNIVVREDETAVFFRDGKVLAYIDRPGRYALTSLNAPVVGEIVKLLSGVQQEAEVYYVQRRILDGKFGSKEPYAFRDKDFGIVLLRLYGEMRYRVKDPSIFINQFVGTFSAETSNDVVSRIRDQMVILVYNVLGKMSQQGLSVLDIPANLMNIEAAILAEAPNQFDQYGIEINKISGLNISLPEEIQKAIEERASMQVLGVNYMQLQAGKAMVDAANNPSGAAGAGAGIGVGMGAGLGMAYPMSQNIAQGMVQEQTKKCPKCGSIVPVSAKFCPNCGYDFSSEDTMTCPYCGAKIPKNSKFCPNCGKPLSLKCPKCGADIPPGAKFCPNCGWKVELP